jgi:hypothetical protein
MPFSSTEAYGEAFKIRHGMPEASTPVHRRGPETSRITVLPTGDQSVTGYTVFLFFGIVKVVKRCAIMLSTLLPRFARDAVILLDQDSSPLFLPAVYSA